MRRLGNAGRKYGQAAIGEIDARSERSVDRREVLSLYLDDSVTAGRSVLITGPTGAGKSWLACALAQYTLKRRPFGNLPTWTPRAARTAHTAHGSGHDGK